jgi:SpoVK/Ycf46/Vps4 family AAA+-type ATPase
MHNFRFSYVFLLLVAAYSVPSHAMGTTEGQEGTDPASFLDQRREIPLNHDFAEHLVNTAPESVRKVKNRLHRGFDRQKFTLLNGPTGTGKTTLASAVATHAGRACFSLNLALVGNEYQRSEITQLINFFEHTFGFDQPICVVLDEINHLTNQKKDKGGPADSMSALWSCMTKVNDNPRITLIATTNNKEQLPEPLLNRCNVIQVDLPGKEKRHAILSYYLLDERIDIGDEAVKWAACKTSGLTCRDLKQIVIKAIDMQYEDDTLALKDCFVCVVNEESISIWSYLNPHAYSDEQWAKIAKYTQRGFTFASTVSSMISVYCGFRQYVLQQKSQKFAEKNAKEQMAFSKDNAEKSTFWQTVGDYSFRVGLLIAQTFLQHKWGPQNSETNTAPQSE